MHDPDDECDYFCLVPVQLLLGFTLSAESTNESLQTILTASQTRDVTIPKYQIGYTSFQTTVSDTLLNEWIKNV